MRNRRYLNINIHGIGYFWNLGLVRIRGSFTAERCLDTISDKLREFGIDLEADIVSVTTDGCSMMRKLGKLIPTLQQLCYAHGLQLVIQDIFYQKPIKSTENSLDYSSETDEYDEEVSSEMEDTEGLTVTGGMEQENALKLNADIWGIVNKVRRIVKLFKRFPLKNEILQAYV